MNVKILALPISGVTLDHFSPSGTTNTSRLPVQNRAVPDRGGAQRTQGSVMKDVRSVALESASDLQNFDQSK
jgi:hypothetical protein